MLSVSVFYFLRSAGCDTGCGDFQLDGAIGLAYIFFFQGPAHSAVLIVDSTDSMVSHSPSSGF